MSFKPAMVRPDRVGERLVQHYTQTLRRHGPSAQGMDWPNAQDLAVRFDVLLSVLDACPEAQPELLDLGCGAGLLVDHLHERGAFSKLRYQGLDLAPDMIAAARARHPDLSFQHRDILRSPLAADSVDVVLMNGVLTERRDVDFASMEAFAHAILTAAFRMARVGVAFNVMSSHVDWERDDLFHWPTDALLAFATSALTRHVTIRADYGLYEYAAFLYRTPRRTGL